MTAGPNLSNLDQVLNFRDFGGIYLHGKRRIKTGVLYRSGHHAHATNADLEQILALRLAAYADLRPPSERSKFPTRRATGCSAQVISHEIENNEISAPHLAPYDDFFRATTVDREALKQRTVDIYRKFIDDPGLVAVYRKTFDELPNLTGPIIIHCHAGKDRTGLLVALILYALGVERDDIFNDYLLTNEMSRIDERFPDTLRLSEKTHGGPVNPEALRFVMDAKADYLTAAFDEMRRKYGSVEGYIETVLGIDSAGQERLRQALLE